MQPDSPHLYRTFRRLVYSELKAVNRHLNEKRGCRCVIVPHLHFIAAPRQGNSCIVLNIFTVESEGDRQWSP